MLKKKFEDVYHNTCIEIMDEYTQDVLSDEAMKYSIKHAENITKKFWEYFNQVGDLHRIVEYVKMKRKKFGRERTEYAKLRGLPEYNELLVELCLRFILNYYGEIKCMKILLSR